LVIQSRSYRSSTTPITTMIVAAAMIASGGPASAKTSRK
jgi:hypothetical protein